MKLLFLAIIEVLLAFPLAQDFGYDSYGRMGSVSSGGCSATYAYLPNSDLLLSTTFRNGGNPVLTATRTWDYGTRLASVLNTVDGAPVTSEGYLYDQAERRTQSNLEDGSFWKYEYDDRGEVTKARHYWSDGTLVEGQHFGYDYDAIGNRTFARLGGDSRDSNLRTQSYTINSLNQYTTIGDTGYRDILGSALATNSVIVNGTNASRKLEYFRQEIGVANSSGPIWQSVMVSSGGSNYTAGLAVPGLSQNLTYDEDGNLIFDGIWSYSWDGENRLASMLMTNLPGAPNRLRLDFTYDYLGRRVQKIVSFPNGGGYTPVYTNRYLYDGWNLVATFKGRSATQNAIQDSYLWGQDLSGTMTGAGGIGGLLMVTTTNGQSFVCHDGNGNVRALVSAADKTIVARYEYGPFGQPLRTTGPQAKANPFRFSSKFTDEESGLVYYGYRYYSPTLGRWISRDPGEERKGLHPYIFVNNNSVANIDPDGQSLLDLLGFTDSEIAQLRSAAFYQGIESQIFSQIGNVCNITSAIARFALTSAENAPSVFYDAVKCYSSIQAKTAYVATLAYLTEHCSEVTEGMTTASGIFWGGDEPSNKPIDAFVTMYKTQDEWRETTREVGEAIGDAVVDYWSSEN